MGKTEQEITTKDIINLFEKANQLFLEESKELILSGVHERTWYFHLSKFLEEEIKRKNFNNYCVDPEYNKNKGKLKTICDDDLNIIAITCDIIVHSRGKNVKKDNLLCIEMKKSTAGKASKLSDRKRLKCLTKESFDDVWSYDGKTLPEHVCRYQLGVYYEINIARQNVMIEYYEKGKLIKQYQIQM